MTQLSGIIHPDLQALPRIQDRMTFLYLEHCQLNREDSAISVRDEKGLSVYRRQPYRCCCWALAQR